MGKLAVASGVEFVEPILPVRRSPSACALGRVQPVEGEMHVGRRRQARDEDGAQLLRNGVAVAFGPLPLASEVPGEGFLLGPCPCWQVLDQWGRELVPALGEPVAGRSGSGR